MKNLTRSELKAIASQCSQYEPVSSQFTSSLSNASTSCETCSHYVDRKCTLDLIDQIYDNMTE
ncbi:hypothetical protein SAMN05661008_00410 [Alkalithermobacter thermoalcaliphilus JW-YL-7 = DSM 7308]|uniref:Uncharacterized protein n=1 Tax=Alkalithermobacter thermoalcaliphilus JW-YL-7 = DSM 7308 TaxID=1121328 RepID=A0A150FP37_CLOPD|nr:hypothetical protein JWYL7_0479 [[Clostridium] paradoxum JW-YL-7 = DSM 7308]SHK52980.1 hypothetical protein SAMN05661008_00410 [[Clostridium] paradoxum JW-YL-7 = DSM 7308]